MNLTIDSEQSHVGNKFPSRNIRVHNEDLFDLLYKQHCDSAQTRCANLVSEALSYGSQANILEKERSQKVKFLVPLMKSKNEAGFLRSMYYQVTLKLGLCCSMYIQYYFLMSDRQYSLLNAIPSKNFWLYRSSTVLFNTIFNINSLNAYDLKSGFGISLRSIQNTSKKYRKNYELVHLVSLLPREDVLAQFDPRSLVEFRFFVMQLMFRRSRQVTRFLRQWFDYSDKDIAHLGIDECTRTGDLTKEQCLQLYCYMRSLRGYRDSTFLQAARQGEENVQALDPDLINR